MQRTVPGEHVLAHQPMGGHRCVEIDLVSREATPSNRRRVDGVGVAGLIPRGAVKFDSRTA